MIFEVKTGVLLGAVLPDESLLVVVFLAVVLLGVTLPSGGLLLEGGLVLAEGALLEPGGARALLISSWLAEL